jgi:hypothetical protein
MGIMYFFIVMIEAKMTKSWWRGYTSNLKDTQTTQYDSAGLRGASTVQAAHLADLPQILGIQEDIMGTGWYRRESV